MRGFSRSVFLVASLIAIILISYGSFAVPSSPSEVVRGASERRDTTVGSNTQESEAGNVTSLFINSTTITQRWQGFYGNITGDIVLDDALNNSLYNWQIVSPQGEVYASNGSSVSWTDIYCANFTQSSGINLTRLNALIGYGSPVEQGGRDSVNATFNDIYGDNGDTFQVGDITIGTGNNCSMVTLNTNDAPQSTNFQEVILTDNASVVFTSIIEQSQTGFQGAPVDFQMIVGVNGTTSGTTLDYYFFIELT